MWKKTRGTAVLAAAAMAVVAGSAQASTLELGFVRISNNSTVNVESQFSATVTDLGAGGVAFDIFNAGPYGSVTEIYFYRRTLAGSHLDTGVFDPGNSSGVDFVSPATPGHLAGLGGTSGPNPDLTLFGSFDATSNELGINSSTDVARFAFSYDGSSTWNDVNSAFRSGDYLIGLHVRQLPPGNQESDSFTSYVIPLPAAGGMGLAGLAVVGGIRRRRI